MRSESVRLDIPAVEHPSIVACMWVDATGVVHSSNNKVSELFGAAAKAGCHIEGLFEAAEAVGILNLHDGSRIAASIAVAESGSIIELRDGRSILWKLSGEANGERFVEFVDVSEVFALAKTRQRDDLTGLRNRQELTRSLARRMEADPDAQSAILYVDLDRFKTVNDTLGHPMGDALLKLVAQRMKGILGENDLLARLGGDEFAILQLDHAQPQAADRLAVQIVEMVSRAYLIGGQVIQIGCSVGIAFVRKDTPSAEDVIRNADIALLQAKTDGRGIVRHFTDAMHERIGDKRAMEIALRRALALQEFTLVYQPQFEIDGHALIGFEALLRWNNETRGYISPGEFIPLAEELGLIGPLGEWVIRSACHEAAAWERPVTIAVNLSPLQFRNANLVNVVVSALASASLEPSRLELEITEGALLDNTDSVLQTLRQLKALGVKISMDDFGTGYSSLAYLQRFPFDKIKIDQSFVRELGTSSQSQAIVAAVIELGRSLGMTTIAEGVETHDQLAALAAIGCDEVQGYLTGRPMTSFKAIELIAVNAAGNRTPQ